jgi:hypothetical protein
MVTGSETNSIVLANRSDLRNTVVMQFQAVIIC